MHGIHKKEKEEDDEVYHDLDLAKIDREIANFSTNVAKLTGDKTLKGAAAKMKKASVIIAKISKYDSVTDKIVTHYMNVNVLLGP